MIVINSSTRQFNIPGADMTFGVEADAGSERKYFQCPRYVGNKLDIASSFVRINYRNANGEIDSYLVEDLTVDGDNVLFSWELYPKVTAYKGQIRFVMCVVGPDTKVAWHTTLGTGIVLEGLEPDYAMIQAGTADVVAQLIAMTEAQTVAVENKGAEWVRNVQTEGTDQITAVQAAGKNAESDAVAEIEAKGVNTRNSIPADYTALSEAVDTLNRTRGAAIVCEAAGSAVAVSDASDMAIQGMKIFGRSTQDGTPTPDAPVEIKSVEKPVVTVCGKNLIPPRVATWEYAGLTFKANADGTVSVVGTVKADEDATFHVVLKDTPLTLPKGDYLLSGVQGGSEKTFRILLYKTDWTFLTECTDGSKPFSLDQTTDVFVYLWVFRGTTVNMTFHPMIRPASIEDGTHETYSCQTVEITHTLSGIPVTSGGNYTDSDGQQWICDEVDFARGMHIQRVELKTFTLYKSTYEFSPLGYRYQHHAGNNFTPGNMCLCRTLPYNPNVGTDMETTDGVRLNNSAGYIIAQYTDVDGTADSIDLDILYILPIPIETALSETEIAAYRALHSNYPNTTVLNDAGAHMVVKYAADTKLYIDNKIAALVGG